MAYSPPLDSVVGILIALVVFYAVPAFLGVILVEIIVLWRLGWGSFLYSLITSFVINLASTLVGIVMVYALDIYYFTFEVGLFLLLFIISVVIEAIIMLGMNRSRHELKEVWRMALIANGITYILLGIGFQFLFRGI
jgi:hypothetical protein